MPVKYSLQLAATSALTAFLWLVSPWPAGAEPLAKAVEAALSYHPSVEAAVANRDAYEQERREQWADHFPSLNLRGAGGRIYGDNSTSRGLTVTRGAAYSYLWEGSATLTQPLFDGFETLNRVDAAQMRRDSAAYGIVDIREDLALRTAAAYIDVLKGREVLQKIRAHEAKLDDYENRIKKMVAEGGADESMIVQAQDIRKQLDGTKADIEGQIRAADARYIELTGHAPDEPMEKPQAQTNLAPDSVDDAVNAAKESHPAFKVASYNERALSYDADAEKQFYYPDVNGELSYLKRDQVDEIGGEVIDAKAVVRVNWDLSIAGGQLARARKAQKRMYEGKARQAETARRIEKDIRTAYSERDSAKVAVSLQNDRVSLNRNLFRNYQAQFEGARVNLLQLLQAENALFNTELVLVNGEYRLLVSQFAVLASLGRLQESLYPGPVKDNDG